MSAPVDDVPAGISSTFGVTGQEVAEQICRAAIGAGMQARKHASHGRTEVVVDHLETEQEKVDRMVSVIDPAASRATAAEVDGRHQV